MGLVTLDHGGAEELADAARTVAEQADVLAAEVFLGLVQQRQQGDVQRGGVAVADGFAV
ncbi:hypothetical protein D3C85_1944460 [compost metagenome]